MNPLRPHSCIEFDSDSSSYRRASDIFRDELCMALGQVRPPPTVPLLFAAGADVCMQACTAENLFLAGTLLKSSRLRGFLSSKLYS